MSWTITSDLDAFDEAAGGFLRSRPVENTLLLGVSAGLRTSGLDLYGDAPPLFGWWQDDGGAVEGAFLQTPPYPPLLSMFSTEAAASLAEVWNPAHPLPGVTGEATIATAFAAAWRRVPAPSRRWLDRPGSTGWTGSPVPTPHLPAGPASRTAATGNS